MSVQAAEQMLKLYDVLYDNDVTMLEINPMVEAQDAGGKKRGIKLLIIKLHGSLTLWYMYAPCINLVIWLSSIPTITIILGMSQRACLWMIIL